MQRSAITGSNQKGEHRLKSSNPADEFLISSWERQSLLEIFRFLKASWPCLMARNIAALEEASLPLLLALKMCLRGQGLQRAGARCEPWAAFWVQRASVLGLGAERLWQRHPEMDGSTWAEQAVKHVEQRAGRREACWGAGSGWGAGEVGWGQLPTSASLPWGRAVPGAGSCQRGFGVCSFSESLCFGFPWGT